ncbi:MAG: glycosyl hydrolase, partial [Gammaproteobacteria bacterium]
APGRPELGTDDFRTPNPPFGALLTYNLREAPTTAHEARQAAEKALRDKGADAPFPGFDRLRDEVLEAGPKVLLIVSDAAGHQVRWIEGEATAGLHRVSWDLRGPSPDPVDLTPPGFVAPWDAPSTGPLMAPGRYSAQLVVVSSSGVRSLGSAQSFQVKPVATLSPGTDVAAVVAFQQQTAEAERRVAAAGAELGRAREQLRAMRATLVGTPRADPALYLATDSVTRAVAAIERRLYGDPARGRLNESDAPSIAGRVGQVIGGHWETRQMPTATQRRELEIAVGGLAELERDVRALLDGNLARLRAAFTAAGAPWIP